jgi:acyl-CoA reductase-like NAD-dependent aldehyde dehydrogenase
MTVARHRVGPDWVESSSPDSIGVLDPATGSPIGAIPAGTGDDADRAVRAARAALPGWARTDAAERGALLKAAARRLRDNAGELAEIQTRENGKPLADSRGGVDAGIDTIEQYAELGPLHRGRSLVGSWGASDMMVHEPRGVAAVIVPWNDPIAIACGAIAACLVTGNTVVFKPSEKTPLSAVRVIELMAEELPDGVLNLLLGDARAGAPLVERSGVDLVMHTGSTATGREIAATCARQLKKCVLELGGKDALIVDAGVDPRWAADQAATGAFANAGQICTSVERIYVHADVAEPFVAALTERARSMRVGPGMDDATEMGPLIDERQRQVVHAHVSDAVERGAEVRAGGNVPSDGGGFFYPPTVIVGADDDTTLMREETFGPVASISVVESFDEALTRANATDYGLAATVLTPSEEHAERAWRELEVGTVKVNAVFGGAPGGSAQPHKRSGLGYGYGPELLDEVTTTKVVHLEAAVTPERS